MKTIGLLILTIFSITTLKAQEMTIGPSGGVGHSWFTGTNEHVVFNPLYNIGAAFVYSSRKHWGFGADVKYSAEGIKVVNQIGANQYNSTIETDYIRMPLRVTYYFTTDDKMIRPKISLGPTLGFLTNVKFAYEDYVNGESIPLFSSRSDFRNFDFGMQASAGVAIRLAKRMWFNADFTYYNGLVKANLYGTETLMNRNLCINVGVAFGIGKK